MVADLDRSNPSRGARIDDIPHFEGKVAGYKSDELCEAKKHIGAVTALPKFIPDFKGKSKALLQSGRVNFLPFPQDCGAVKSLG